MSRHSVPAALPRFAEYRSQPDFGCRIPHDRDEWFIAPCGRNRDSDTLTRSNWEVMCEELNRIDPNGDTEEDEDNVPSWEIHRFGHWACGWVEISIVRPGTAAADYVHELAESLSDYPVADESHFSELEYEEAAESWDSWGAKDFATELRDKFLDDAPRVAEFIRDEATADQLREFMTELYPNEDYHFDSGGCNFPIGRAVDNCGRDELARFARLVRASM